MTRTQQEQQDLTAAGFSNDEITDWALTRRQELSDAGFSEGEILAEFGSPPLDPAPAAKVFEENIRAATQPETEGGEPKPVLDFMGALEAGLQSSVSGLLKRGKAPDLMVPEDAPRLSRIASSLGTLAGDIPFMVGGALAGAGGGPVTATAGGFALPAGMRKVLMDSYEEGSAESFEDFWERASGAIIETGKAWITGAATGGAGKLIKLAPIASPTAKAAAVVAGEVTTMAAVGKALEGEMPTADDFIDTAIVVGGLKGSVNLAGKMRKVYADKNVKPTDIVQDLDRDVTITQDLLSENVEIPRSYGGVPPEPNIGPDAAGALIRFIPEAQQQTPPPGGAGAGAGGAGTPPPGSAGRTAQGAAPGSTPSAPPPTMTPAEAWKAVQSRISAYESPDKEPVTFQKLYTMLIDDLNPLREASKQMQKDITDGREIGTSDDFYQLGRLTRGSFGKSSQMIEYGTFDFRTYENTGPSLKAILNSGGKDMDMNRFSTYLAAKRDIELTARGITTGIDHTAAKIVAKDGAAFEPIRKQLLKYQDELTRYLRDAGVVSEEVYDKMREANKEYVPFFRVMEEDGGGGSLGRGVNVKQPLHSIKGSERVIIDPLESIIKNTYSYVALAERNAVGNAYIRMANRTGNAGQWYTKIKPEIRGTTMTEPEIQALFDEFVTARKKTTTTSTTASTTTSTTPGGTAAAPLSKQAIMVRDRVLEALGARGFSKGESEQMVARLSKQEAGSSTIDTIIKEITKTEYVQELDIRLPNEVATIFRAVRTPLKPNEIAVFESGKYVKYEVPSDIAQAFKSMDRQSANLLVKVMAIPAQTLRAGVVLNPDFMMRNFVRDQTSAFSFSKAGYIPVVDFFRGVGSLIGRDADFQNWLKSGGANSAMISMDRQYLQQQLSTILEVQGVRNRAWNTAKTAFESLRIISETIENATRLGEFKKVAGGFESKRIIQEGGMASREITVDFARMGAKTRAMSMITAFFNAAVQGEDRMIRAFAENPMGTTVKMMASITLPSVLLYIANKDDPRWKEIPQWQKDLFWIVMTDDHVFRIPKPHSAGIIFGSLVERMLESYESDHPGMLKDLEKSLLDTMVPNMIPTAPGPIVEQFSNRSLFTGSPLIPSDVESKLPEAQYTEYTTEAAKALGRLFGAFPGMQERALRDEDTFLGGVARALTSPALIENYIRGWTGGLGMYALQIADKALREAGVLPDPVGPVSTLADIPVVKAFVVRYPSATAQSIQTFMDDYFAQKKVYDTYTSKLREGDLEAAERIQRDYDPAWNELASLRRTLTEHSKLIRMIHKNPEFSDTDQRQLIDELYSNMIALSKDGNALMADIKEGLK